MKKLLTLAALMGVVTLSHAQGVVNFFNTSTTTVKTNGILNGANSSVNAGAYNGAPLSTPAGASWYYELLASSSATTIDASLAGWTPVFTGTNTTLAGRLSGQNRTDGAVALPAPFAAGSAYNFAVVGWSANLGTDFAAVFAGAPTAIKTSGIAGFGAATWATLDAAPVITPTGAGLGGWYGISGVAVGIAANAPGSGYNNVFGGTGIGGFSLNYYAVPEPGTLALAGLGAAAMLIFRRRK